MKRTVSAGDLEKYAYCPLSWWLGRSEFEHSEAELRGMERHEEVESKIEDIALKEKESRNMERFVFWFSFTATTLSFLGLIVWPISSGILTSRILLAEALLWLVFSLYFLREFERKKGGERRALERLILSSSIASTIVAIYAVVGLALPRDIWISRIMQILALVWLMGASFFLRRSVTRG